MATQKFLGANQLVKRLSAQVGSHDLAVKLLRQRGQMEQNSEKLTAAGLARDKMTASERAIDRASKKSGNRSEEHTSELQSH